MLHPTLYLLLCSARNRFRRRLRRLREPRYLIGGLVGTAYLYLAIFGRINASRRAARRGQRTDIVQAAFLPLLGGSGPVLGGLSLLVMAALAFVLPASRGLLQFSDAERDMLLSAPLSNRQLLIYRLLQSQWRIAFSALIVALTYPLASSAARVRGFIGAWLVLSAFRLFFAGVSLTSSGISERQRHGDWRRLWPRLLVGGGILAVAIGAVRRAAAGEALESVWQVFELLAAAGADGAARIVLWPFVSLLQPLFAAAWIPFATSLPAALAVYAALVFWVLASADTFAAAIDSREEKSRSAESRPRYRARDTWPLAPAGRPEIAFVWKGALQTFRIVSRRLLIRAAIILAWLTVAVVLVEDRARGGVRAVAVVGAMATAFAVLFGPQIARIDLRQDLQRLELFKTWPVRGAAVVRGQMLWPGLMVSAVALVLGLFTWLVASMSFGADARAWLAPAGLSLLMLLPGLVFAQFAVHNAAALLFPAWISSGTGRPRGVDAMGQRLIMLAGTWLVMLFGILPAALVAAVLWFAFYRFVGPWVLFPGAAIGLAILLAEVLLVTELLGPVYDRLDITSVERTDA